LIAQGFRLMPGRIDDQGHQAKLAPRAAPVLRPVGSGGVLLLETQNAIGIQGEVEVLLDESGFTPLLPGVRRDPSVKYRMDVWPTG